MNQSFPRRTGVEGLVTGYSQTWRKFSCVLSSHLGQEGFQPASGGVAALPAMNSFSAHTWAAAAWLAHMVLEKVLKKKLPSHFWLHLLDILERKLFHSRYSVLIQPLYYFCISFFFSSGSRRNKRPGTNKEVLSFSMQGLFCVARRLFCSKIHRPKAKQALQCKECL